MKLPKFLKLSGCAGVKLKNGEVSIKPKLPPALPNPDGGSPGSELAKDHVMSFAVSLGKETACEPGRCLPRGKGGRPPQITKFS
jgi:hypothetical protein